MASEAEGCFGAQTCTSKEDRGVLVAISRWESEQALERFMDGPPMKEAMSGASGLFQGQQVEHFVST
jgi:quinol monooxygenase YgiN